ncbi:hypothetical protein AAMO2058_000786000 [Amorphochlora amoebiformis]
MSVASNADELQELKAEIAKLKGEIAILEAVKVTPAQAAAEIVAHLKKSAEVDPIMATDNPWRPPNNICCIKPVIGYLQWPGWSHEWGTKAVILVPEGGYIFDWVGPLVISA